MTTSQTPASNSSDKPSSSGGAWARELGDAYSRIAQNTESPMKAEANAAEASKYYGIADRMDRALPAQDIAEEDPGTARKAAP